MKLKMFINEDKKHLSARRLSVVLCSLVLVLVLDSCEGKVLVKRDSSGGSSTGIIVDTPVKIGAYRKNFKGVVTEVLSEKGDSEIILPYLNIEDNFYFGKSIQLDCNASFPVQWVYTGNGAPVVHTETFRLARDFDEPATYEFRASVIFSHTQERQTGNYSCQSINAPITASSFYVYVPGNTSTFIEYHPHSAGTDGVKIVISVNAKARDEWVNLPCAVADPNAKVQLYKYLTNDTLEHLEPNERVVYDPRRGFNLKVKKGEESYGKYVCSTENNGRAEKLQVRVQPMEESDMDNEVPSSNEDPLELVYDHRHSRIVCCNRREEKIPQIISTGCESVSDCDIKKKYLRSKPCPGACEQHVVRVNDSCAAYELSETREAGMIECVQNDFAVFYQFSKENDVILTDFNELPPIDKILTIMKEDIPSKNEKDRYVCHANSFFFSTGLKMAWENADGSMDFVEEIHFPLSNAIEVDEKHNLTRLYCFAPIWNSATMWKNVSIFVQ